MEKKCSVCHVTKSLDKFWKTSARHLLGVSPWCKECRKAYDRQRRSKSPQKTKDYYRAYYAEHRDAIAARGRAYYHQSSYKKRLYNALYRLRNKYGLTHEEAKNLYQKQRTGNCEICGQKSDKTLHIDHDHITKRVRGILCRSCNLALGFLGDSAHIARQAALYLEKKECYIDV